MRKVVLVSIAAFAVVTLLFLAGCGEKNEATNGGSTTVTGGGDATGKAKVVEFTQPG